MDIITNENREEQRKTAEDAYKLIQDFLVQQTDEQNINLVRFTLGLLGEHYYKTFCEQPINYGGLEEKNQILKWLHEHNFYTKQKWEFGERYRYELWNENISARCLLISFYDKDIGFSLSDEVEILRGFKKEAIQSLLNYNIEKTKIEEVDKDLYPGYTNIVKNYYNLEYLEILDDLLQKNGLRLEIKSNLYGGKTECCYRIESSENSHKVYAVYFSTEKILENILEMVAKKEAIIDWLEDNDFRYTKTPKLDMGSFEHKIKYKDNSIGGIEGIAGLRDYSNIYEDLDELLYMFEYIKEQVDKKDNKCDNTNTIKLELNINTGSNDKIIDKNAKDKIEKAVKKWWKGFNI